MNNNKIVPPPIQRTTRNCKWFGNEERINQICIKLQTFPDRTEFWISIVNREWITAPLPTRSIPYRRLGLRRITNATNRTVRVLIELNNPIDVLVDQQRPTPYERSATKRMSSNDFTSLSNRIQNYQLPPMRRPVNSAAADSYYQNHPNRNGRGDIRRTPIPSRDREYEAMARALIEAHRESRYTFNQPPSSQRRYNHPMESRGYPTYRRWFF